MATAQDTIKRMRIEVSATGLKETADGFVKLAGAQGDATDATSGLTGAFNALERQFSDQMRQQQASTAQSSSATQAIVAMTGAIGAAIAVAIALATATAKFSAELAEMALSAKRAGLELEAFQKLQFAGGLEGLSSKNFGSGVESLAKNLNDATRSENDLSKLFDANNVKLKQANGLVISTNTALDVARDLIHRAATEQDKIKIAEMLGLTKEWVPVLDKSADAFRAAQEQATKTGVVISDDLIKKAEEFDREWRQSSLVFSTWLKAQLAEVIPFIQQLIDKAGELASKARDAANKSLPSLDKGVPIPLPGVTPENQKNVEQGVNALVQAFQILVDTGGNVELAMGRLTGKMTEQQKQAVANAAAAREMADAWKEVDAATAAAGKTWGDIAKGLSAVNDNVNIAVGGFTKIPDKVDESKDALDRAIESIERHNAVIKADAQAQGLGAAALAEYQAKANLTTAADRAGADEADKRRQRFDELAVSAGKAAAALAKAKVDSDTQFQDRTALLSPQNLQIAQQLRGIYGNDVPAALASSEAAAIRFNNAVKQAKDDAVEFSQSFVKGLMDGKSVADSLSNALKNLSAKLADRAILDLLSGDFAKAAVEGISAIATYIGSIFSKSQGPTAQQVQAQISAFERAGQFTIRAATAANDNSTLAGKLASFDADALKQRYDEYKAGGQAMVQLEQALAAERVQIIADFNKQAADQEKQAAAAALQRSQSFQDRIFAATTDTTTLEGQLTLFDRQAQRDREAEVAAGGQALTDLEAAQAAERLNVIKDFNDKATENTKQAAQAQLDAQTQAAKKIVDYVNGLQVGPDSSLSPQARLAAATATYQAILPLAQAGNVDALNRVTQDFENLRKAAKDFYGSSSGYQSILSNGITQLLGLPAVAQATDPVVTALANVETAINATTTAVGGTTTAVGGTTSAVQTDTLATAQRLDVSISKLSDVVNNLISAINSLNAVVGRLDTSNAILAAMQSIEQTSRDTLTLLNNNLTITGGSVHAAALGLGAGNANTGPYLAGAGSLFTSNNNVLTALNKIVLNTWATAQNTANANAAGYINSISWVAGTLARGGWINGPGGPSDDRAGLYALSNGEYVVNAMAARALTQQFGRGVMDQIGQGRAPVVPVPVGGANDNSALLGEVRALRAEVAALKDAMAKQTRVTAGVGEALLEPLEEMRDGMSSQARESKLAGQAQQVAA